MRSAEMISRVAIAGGLLGAVGGGVNLATNPEIQKLSQERQAIVQQYDWDQKCARDVCVDFIKGDTPEEQEALQTEFKQRIQEVNNDPRNRDARNKQIANSILVEAGAIGAYAGFLSEVFRGNTKKAEEETKEI